MDSIRRWNLCRYRQDPSHMFAVEDEGQAWMKYLEHCQYCPINTNTKDTSVFPVHLSGTYPSDSTVSLINISCYNDFFWHSEVEDRKEIREWYVKDGNFFIDRK